MMKDMAVNKSQVLQNSSFDAKSSILTSSIDEFQSIQHTGDLEDDGDNQRRSKSKDIAASASRRAIKHQTGRHNGK